MSTNEDTLETKLSALLKALHQNGKDEWEGKPEQKSLEELISDGSSASNIASSSSPSAQELNKALSSSGAPKGSSKSDVNDATLEDLMNVYVENVRQYRQCGLPNESDEDAESAKNEKAPSAQVPSPGDDGGLQSLLSALDDLPELKLSK